MKGLSLCQTPRWMGFMYLTTFHVFLISSMLKLLCTCIWLLESFVFMMLVLNFMISNVFDRTWVWFYWFHCLNNRTLSKDKLDFKTHLNYSWKTKNEGKVGLYLKWWNVWKVLMDLQELFDLKLNWKMWNEKWMACGQHICNP